jgi:hypothetical protein
MASTLLDMSCLFPGEGRGPAAQKERLGPGLRRGTRL